MPWWPSRGCRRVGQQRRTPIHVCVRLRLQLPKDTAGREARSLVLIHAGSMLREEFNLAAEVPRLHVPTPCQSTGLWYLQPTNASVAFMRALVDRIAYHAVYEW